MAHTYLIWYQNHCLKKPILAKFLGHYVPPAIGPLTDHSLISSPTHEMNIPLGVKRCVGSPTLTRVKTNSQYINGCNPYLTNRFCGIELGLNLTFNILISLTYLI